MQRSLRHDIYLTLRGEILKCQITPNSELREQLLAERFEVSKSPVREALLRLEQERLIKVTPRQGYRVTPISLEDASELFHLRKVLEPACVDAATATAPEPILLDLEEFRSFDGPDGQEAFIEYNRRFHFALCRASGNARMAALTCDIIEQMERMIRFSVTNLPPQDRSLLVEEHNAIIDAVAARDRRNAARLVRDHVAAAEKRVITGLSRAAVHL